jgi:PAS domain-containing protein
VDETTRLRAVLEATTAFVGLADARGRLLEMNDAGRRLCGLADDEPLPDSLLALHPPWAAWRVASEGVAVASRDGLWSGETAVLGPGGVEVPVTEVLIGHYDSAASRPASS